MLILCGLGWLADNMWLQCVAVILPRVQQHFQVPNSMIGLLSSSIFLGMMVGSLFWGFFSDTNGRQSAFNWTLAVAAFFGILSSMAPDFSSLCICLLLLGFGVGGNMPVDGALFLEFIPRESQHLLTFLSVFFSFGAVLSSLLAWLILPQNSCPDIISPSQLLEVAVCNVEIENNGWRYLLLSLGLLNLLMVVARVVIFQLPESPKFLMSQNRPEDVVVVLRRIVRINGSQLSVSLGDIQVPSPSDYGSSSPEFIPEDLSIDTSADSPKPLSWNECLRRVVPLFRPHYLKTTVLVWMVWTFTSLAYTMFNVFLPKYLEMKNGSDSTKVPTSSSEVYGSYLIYSLCGIPGSMIGSYLVETVLGRKGSMALSSVGSALALLGFAKANSSATITFSSGIFSFLITILYAILYAYTPEVFDAKVRGTACGIASALGRIAGMIAPLVTGGLLSVSLSLPNYLSAAMFLLVGACSILLPIETKGRAN
ncbi:hypothetical protein DSO57_1001871 [Entomophthora muscae]|uniref:Uncharacterized protein n=1 Tax=Entomophthora muscae TaxID=34485 RepID=A0ACC2TJM8_9FUNG|nr:hypothetical protein DSO57_1001871 [Entomophthora muscae]